MGRATGAVAMMMLSVLLVLPSACSSPDPEPAPSAPSAPAAAGEPTAHEPPVTAAQAPATSAPNSAAPGPAAPWLGITVDTTDHLDTTIAAIAALPVAPVVRMVFDLDQDPASYNEAVTRLAQHATVMAQVVDSSDFTSITGEQYLDRFRTYVGMFGDRIPLWETGNEVNGEWLGDPAPVVAAITGADQIVRERGLTSVLTLYYNPHCADDAGHDMFAWAEQQLTSNFRNSLPYGTAELLPGSVQWLLAGHRHLEQTFADGGHTFPAGQSRHRRGRHQR